MDFVSINEIFSNNQKTKGSVSTEFPSPPPNQTKKTDTHTFIFLELYLKTIIPKAEIQFDREELFSVSLLIIN